MDTDQTMSENIYPSDCRCWEEYGSATKTVECFHVYIINLSNFPHGSFKLLEIHPNPMWKIKFEELKNMNQDAPGLRVA